MTTTEKNKLLAEFLGVQHQKMAMNFNSNWNLLMEVVEKIEMLGFIFSIKKNWAKITKDKIAIVVRWEEDKNKIEAVYNASLEFIKWYNQNKI